MSLPKAKEEGLITISNLTPYTQYCHYCGHKERPGTSHRCWGNFEEQREPEEESDDEAQND